MDAAPKYRLVPVVALAPTVEVDAFPLFEFDPASTKRYVVAVECGDLPPTQALDHLEKVKNILADLLGPKTFLLVAVREGKPALQFFQLEPVPS